MLAGRDALAVVLMQTLARIGFGTDAVASLIGSSSAARKSATAE
jgi:hypothetical protein